MRKGFYWSLDRYLSNEVYNHRCTRAEADELLSYAYNFELDEEEK